MYFKAFELAFDLLNSIREQNWNESNIIIEKLKKILDTYKESC